MSEYTIGILFFNVNKPLVEDYCNILQSDRFMKNFTSDWHEASKASTPAWRMRFDDRSNVRYLIHEVNNKWGALLLEDFVQNLHYDSVKSLLYAMSEKFPLLMFDHAEDHGWSYQLINSRSVVASVDVNYELEWSLVYDLLEARHPDLGGNPVELFDSEPVESLYELVRQSEAYQQRVEAMYRNHKPEQFKIFGLADKAMAALKERVSVEKYRYSFKSMQGQVDSFQKILDIEEASWMSYRYLASDEDESE